MRGRKSQSNEYTDEYKYINNNYHNDEKISVPDVRHGDTDASDANVTVSILALVKTTPVI